MSLCWKTFLPLVLVCLVLRITVYVSIDDLNFIELHFSYLIPYINFISEFFCTWLYNPILKPICNFIYSFFSLIIYLINPFVGFENMDPNNFPEVSDA